MRKRKDNKDEPASTSILDRFTSDERSEVLAGLLDMRPPLVEEAEQLAEEILGVADADSVAKEVKNKLQNLDLDMLAARSGKRYGGYVEGSDAAFEMVDAALQPYLGDIQRRADLGLMEAVSEIGIGLLEGLAACRNANDASVLDYAGPDTAVQLAEEAIGVLQKVGMRLPSEYFDDLPDEWSEMWAPLIED